MKKAEQVLETQWWKDGGLGFGGEPGDLGMIHPEASLGLQYLSAAG